MALNKTANSRSHQHPPEFSQQLAKDFPYEGVDEEELRRYTEQWVTCASELLGVPPAGVKEKTKR